LAQVHQVIVPSREIGQIAGNLSHFAGCRSARKAFPARNSKLAGTLRNLLLPSGTETRLASACSPAPDAGPGVPHQNGQYVTMQRQNAA
jgi:hypothetical protein